MKGNEYYRLRINVGAPRIFGNPEEFAEAINSYFEFVENNPLKEGQLMKAKINRDEEEVKVYKLSKLRAMSLQGLCSFLGINTDTFYEYEKKAGFTAIATHARQIMFAQKFEGAAAGLLNSSIIARELGLVDKTEQKVIQDQPIFGDDKESG